MNFFIRKKTNLIYCVSAEKGHSDLTVDEDVDGETLMGSGKSGVMANDVAHDSPPQFNTKSQPSRPVLAKQKSGMILSNNDVSQYVVATATCESEFCFLIVDGI